MNLYNFMLNNKNNILCKIFSIDIFDHKYCFEGQYQFLSELPSNMYEYHINCVYYTCFNHYVIFLGYSDDPFCSINLDDAIEYFDDKTEVSDYSLDNSPVEIIDHQNNYISIQSLLCHMYHSEFSIIIEDNNHNRLSSNIMRNISSIPAELLNRKIIHIYNHENVSILHLIVSNETICNQNIYIDTFLDIIDTQNLTIVDCNCNPNTWYNTGENQYISLIDCSCITPVIHIKTHP